MADLEARRTEAVRHARAWLRTYAGSIDSQALLLAHMVGQRHVTDLLYEAASKVWSEPELREATRRLMDAFEAALEAKETA